MHSQVKSVASLSLLYAFRMLGLFMVLPVMMLYGDGYAGATPFLLGVALGAYGLTQAIFQIPLGLLSDLFGRKPVILIGLLIFAVGSLVAGSATSIEGLIIGRALQGAGAIASAIMAMVADLTTEDNRTKAMAAIGASIGLSFSIAMVLGPVLASVAGLSGVFFATCGLALLGVLVLLFVVPKPAQPTGKSHRDSGAIPALMGKTAQNPQLLRLNLGIFSLHFVLMSAFVVVPRILESGLGIARENHWHIYLGLLLGALIIMMPFMMLAERKRMVKQVFLLAIFLLGAALVALALWHTTAMVVITLLLLFFVAFNLLEATLPSLVSKVAPAGAKGTAMGLYSTSQFLGAFAGGTLGGWLLEQNSATAVLYVAATVTALWLLVAIFMQAPRYLTSICINVGGDFARTPAVLSVTGVAEALMVPEEGLLYLKVDRQALDQQQLAHVVGTEV